MRLITKKCPNCGASLSFDEKASKIKCEYCKQDIFIERDKHHSNQMSDEEYQLSLEAVQEVTNMMQKNSFYGMIVVLVIIAIGAIIFIISFSNIFRFSEKFDSIPSENVGENKNYVTSISQINEESLKLLQHDSLDILNTWTNTLPDNRATAWEYVGMYLLTPKKIMTNELYIVYKRTYTIDSKQIENYGAVSYKDIKLKDGNVSNTSIGFPVAPMSLDDNMEMPTFGYDSNEDFYNQVIKPKTDQYEVQATSGIYF